MTPISKLEVRFYEDSPSSARDKWLVAIYNRPTFRHGRVVERNVPRRLAEASAAVWADFLQCKSKEGPL